MQSGSNEFDNKDLNLQGEDFQRHNEFRASIESDANPMNQL